MIECPFCQQSLREVDPECPKCGMTSDKLAKIMGPMPVIFGGVTQEGDYMSSREMKRLQKVVDKYQQRFPQSRLHLLMRSFPQEMDFKVILFWVFNQAGLSEQGAKGGKNRDVVFLIAPRRRRAGLIVGYGLEPLLSQESMDEVVESGRGALESGEFARAFEAMVDDLTGRFQEISEGLPEVVGLPVKLTSEKSDQF